MDRLQTFDVVDTGCYRSLETFDLVVLASTQKDIINKTILSLPYCERRQMIAKIIECSECELGRSCFLCKKEEGISHRVTFTRRKFKNLKIPEKFNFIKDCPCHGNQDSNFYQDLSFIMSLKRKKCVRALVLSHPLSC